MIKYKRESKKYLPDIDWLLLIGYRELVFMNWLLLIDWLSWIGYHEFVIMDDIEHLSHRGERFPIRLPDSLLLTSPTRIHISTCPRETPVKSKVIYFFLLSCKQLVSNLKGLKSLNWRKQSTHERKNENGAPWGIKTLPRINFRPPCHESPK